MPRHLSPNRAKVHRSYTVEEVARIFGVHRNTVRQWLKAGLPTIDDKRPLLILGRALGDFLRAKRQRWRRSCGSGELYCVRCHAPRRPLDGAAKYVPLTTTSGNLVGTCPDCGCSMFRRVALGNVEAVRGGLAVTVEDAPHHLTESPYLSGNSDFRPSPDSHGKAQRK
jgi:hypothetical protein